MPEELPASCQLQGPRASGQAGGPFNRFRVIRSLQRGERERESERERDINIYIYIDLYGGIQEYVGFRVVRF